MYDTLVPPLPRRVFPDLEGPILHSLVPFRACFGKSYRSGTTTKNSHKFFALVGPVWRNDQPIDSHGKRLLYGIPAKQGAVKRLGKVVRLSRASKERICSEGGEGGEGEQGGGEIKSCNKSP